MRNNKFIAILITVMVLFNSTMSFAFGDVLMKEDAIKENRSLEKKITKQIEDVASRGKYKKNEFEVKKCFAFGGDMRSNTKRTIIIEVSSSKQFEEDDVLTIYTNILKEVKKFNSSNKTDIYKLGIWFVDECTGKTIFNWNIEGETINYLDNISFWSEQKAKEDIYKLLF